MSLRRTCLCAEAAILSLIAFASSGCGGSSGRIRPTRSFGQTVCDAIAASPNPTPWVVGGIVKGSMSVPNFQAGQLVAVRYQGCSLRVVPECRGPSGYQYQALSLTHAKSDRQTFDAAKVSTEAPFLSMGLGGGLGASEEVGVETAIAGRWSSSRDIVTLDQIEGAPECRTPGYVTHWVRSADVGAYFAVRGNRQQLEANANVPFFGFGSTSGASAGNIEQGGEIQACFTGNRERCSMPIRFYLSAITPGGTVAQCAPQNAFVDGLCQDPSVWLRSRGWQVYLQITAPGCVDGSGGCEIGYEVSVGSAVFAKNRGPQDANFARVDFERPLDGYTLQSGLRVTLMELDAFQNDFLGQCDVRVDQQALVDSASRHAPLQLAFPCGRATIQLNGMPLP